MNDDYRLATDENLELMIRNAQTHLDGMRRMAREFSGGGNSMTKSALLMRIACLDAENDLLRLELEKATRERAAQPNHMTRVVYYEPQKVDYEKEMRKNSNRFGGMVI